MAKIDKEMLLIGAGVLVVGFVVYKAASSARGLVSDASASIGGAVSSVADGVGSIFSGVKNTVVNAGSSIVDTAESGVSWLGQKFGALSNFSLGDWFGTSKAAPAKPSTPVLLSSPFSANSKSIVSVNANIPAWNDFSFLNKGGKK